MKALEIAEDVPEPLRSPEAHRKMTIEGDLLICPVDGPVGRRVGSVWSFMDTPDAFYEGKFNNRIRYLPRNDGFLATLPLGIVTQGYTRTVATEVAEGGTVVEIGCAGGVAWFGKRYRMLGIDLSQEALLLAAEDYDRVLQCDASQMPLAACSVDAVISSCLFEHLTVEQKRDLLAESARVLKPGGKIVFLYDLWTDNPVIAHYRSRDPELYQRLFLEGDGHLGYENVNENRGHFQHAGLRIDREIFHERSPVLSNSVWKKLSQWPGWPGTVGGLGVALTSGLLHLPSLGLLSLTDVTLGRLLPHRYARLMTTVATKT